MANGKKNKTEDKKPFLKADKRVLGGIGAALLLLGVLALLYLAHPLGPVLFVGSLLIQTPIVALFLKTKSGGSYRARAAARRKRFEETGNAEEWLAAEKREANGAGMKYFSPEGKALSAINRADALLQLGRINEAAAMLAQAEDDKPAEQDRPRFAMLEQQIATHAKQTSRKPPISNLNNNIKKTDS